MSYLWNLSCKNIALCKISDCVSPYHSLWIVYPETCLWSHQTCKTNEIINVCAQTRKGKFNYNHIHKRLWDTRLLVLIVIEASEEGKGEFQLLLKFFKREIKIWIVLSNPFVEWIMLSPTFFIISAQMVSYGR